MTQIQLIDLCSRVPYHPKGHVVNACNGAECDEWLTCATFSMFTSITNNSRLYLRPMSSMTEEEKIELYQISGFYYLSNNELLKDEWRQFSGALSENKLFLPYPIWEDDLNKVYDWLNAHHFDFRNLIGRGLAIDCTGLNIY